MAIPSQGRCSKCQNMSSDLHNISHNTSYCKDCFKSWKVKRKKYLRKWRAKKSDERNAYFKSYRLKNRGKISKQTSNRRAEKIKGLGPEELKKFRKKENDHAKKFTIKLKFEVLKAYGGKCICCGETQPYFLTIDHVYNDGASDRKINGSGRRFYHYLKRLGFPKDRYQILCYNCNNAKRILGYCPHRQGVTTIPQGSTLK